MTQCQMQFDFVGATKAVHVTIKNPVTRTRVNVILVQLWSNDQFGP